MNAVNKRGRHLSWDTSCAWTGYAASRRIDLVKAKHVGLAAVNMRTDVVASCMLVFLI